MFYLYLYAGLFIFVLVSGLLSYRKYKKLMRNKTVGIHDKLYKEKMNMETKVNNFNIGYHLFIDEEKKKWALISDNPKKCDIYSYSSLKDYVLILNGEDSVRSSMKNVVIESKIKKCHNITLDIFTSTTSYRIVFLNHEERVIENSFIIPYKSANDFCDYLDKILGI